MRVGIYPVLDPEAGGIYQYSLAVLDAMGELRNEFEPVIVHDRARSDVLESWTLAGWQLVSTGPPGFRSIARRTINRTLGTAAALRAGRLARRLRGVAVSGRTSKVTGASMREAPPRQPNRRLSRRGIGLMLFPSPSSVAFRLGVPYIMAVHDLQHRIHPEFPEVTASGAAEYREFLYTNGICQAEAVLVDSEVGREDVLEFYGHLTTPDRIRVLPFVPPPYLVRATREAVSATLVSIGLPDRYLLFPAQFWPHKNHVRVTEAVALLRRDDLDVTVVMTGSAAGPIRAGVLADVVDIVARDKIGDLVRVLGYVDNATIAALYSGATGVLLPTFFGPTNIPVVEGWAMGVPVITSDIRGIREQCGDAAVLVDPLDTAAIANGIRRIWTDAVLRDRLVRAGTERLRSNQPTAFRDGLASVLRDVQRGLLISDLRGDST